MSNSKQTQWMHEHDLVRPGIYLPRELWNQFERAVAVENYHRAKDALPPVSRTIVVAEFVRKWSEKKLHDAPPAPGSSDEDRNMEYPLRT